MKTISPSRRSLVLLLLAAPLPACSDEFLDCVHEWQTCTEVCPPAGPLLEAAEAAYRECLEGCPTLDPNGSPSQQLAAGRCIDGCTEAKAAAIEGATRCGEECDDEFVECTAAIRGCSDPTSAQNLLTVEVADWGAHSSGLLADPTHAVSICEDHFPTFSAQRSEVLAALQQIDDVPGCTIDFTPISLPHLDKSVIFTDPPLISTVDYVDNAADTFIHPCHADNTTDCYRDVDNGVFGYVINTCSYTSGGWNGGGDRQAFSINANGACYDYFSDPNSDDYMSTSGALHEFAHTAGMKDMNGWPDEDKEYISTMQGNLEYLSAFDVAYLREHYPAPAAPTRDFVASSKIRFDYGGPNYVDGTFGEANPARLYLVGDQLFDCSSGQPAVFRAAWFNTGNADQEAEHCMINELRIEDPATYHEAKVVSWHAAAMPAESQDHWVGASDTAAADFFGIGRGRDVDLVFEVNVYEQYRERSNNNIVKTPVRLFDSSACTAPPPQPSPPPPIKQTGPTAYEIAGPFLNQVVADPTTIARGAVLVPAPVGGAGLGLKIKSLDEGSALKLMGAKVGDILWRVDGQPITGPGTAFTAMARLQAGATVNVAYARGSSMRQATYKKK